MSTITTHSETPTQPSPIELWERKAVLAFFGGKRPLHVSDAVQGHSRRTCIRSPSDVSGG